MKVELVIDIGQILAAIVGLLSLAVSIRNLRGAPITPAAEPRRQGRESNLRWMIFAALGAAFLLANLALVGWRFLTPRIAITDPQEGDRVEIAEEIRGTGYPLPEGQALWVIVYSPISNRFYPQVKPAEVTPDGSWQSWATIGVEGDAGKEFDIMAVLVDGSAQAVFESYLMEADANHSWPGLTSLPPGAEEKDHITVTRK